MSQALLELEEADLQLGHRSIWDGLSLKIFSGDKVVLRGANGAGKTSIFRAILGLVPISNGSIRFRNCEIFSRQWRLLRHLIAWVPQESIPHPFPISVEELVSIGYAGRRVKLPRFRGARVNMPGKRELRANLWGARANPPGTQGSQGSQAENLRSSRIEIEEVLALAGAENLAGRCYHKLSGGEKQRVSIARCLAQGAEILLLDEPLTSLDSQSRERITELVNQLVQAGKTLLVATHEQTCFKSDDWKEYQLLQGKLHEGKPHEGKFCEGTDTIK